MSTDLSSFSRTDMSQNLRLLEQDNLMLQGMNEHALTAEQAQLAQKIANQLEIVTEMVRTPTLGAQQLVASKVNDEIRKVKERVQKILEQVQQKPDRAVESNHKPNTGGKQ